MTAQMVQDVLMFEGEKMKWINGGRTRTRTLDPLIKSQRLKIEPKRAIRLSRKDWHSRANRAVLSPVPDDECVPGSCPAGLKAEVGLRWWRRYAARIRMEDPDA